MAGHIGFQKRATSADDHLLALPGAQGVDHHRGVLPDPYTDPATG
jgi:hypothetical protein